MRSRRDEAHDAAETAAAGLDLSAGLVPRWIFTDPGVYDLEQQQIFRRCWLFLGHEGQIPNTGDYITTRMADTNVIVCRDVDGHVQGLVNSCRHRGNSVCRTDGGTARTFTCPYHGWAYDLQGKRVESGGLINVPGMKPYYDDKLDLSLWGLVPVTKVESYRGLIFGTFDAEAPTLEEYLGEMRWAIDMILDRGDLRPAPGALRWRSDANWKFAADNGGDNAHVQVSHRSAFLAFSKLNGVPPPKVGTANPGFTILTKYGHMGNFQTGLGDRKTDLGKGFQFASNTGMEYWRNRPETMAKLGPLKTSVLRYNINIFPNLFIIDRLFVVRHPIGPTEMEQRFLSLYDASTPEDVQAEELRTTYRRLGPTGFLEQEDGENFIESTRGSSYETVLNHDLNYAMGLNDLDIVADGQSPPRIDGMHNEHGQLWFYRNWASAVSTRSWPTPPEAPVEASAGR